MNFFIELKRRNVFKVGAAYMVVAWLIIQFINNVAGPLNFPTWIPAFFIVLLGIGFPIALILAWAFELTPEGIKPSAQVDPDTSIRAHTGQRINLLIICALSVAVLFLLVDNNVLNDATPAPAQTALSVDTSADADPDNTGSLEKSIAVLPFANLSSDPEQEYFSDGLAEELLNKLAQVPDLQVAARTSSFSFKGRNEDMRVIAETLGVNYLLEGSVRSSGDQLRITAQLIQANNGFHLWSATFDRQLADIFAIQDEISLAVSTALQVTLGTGTFALPGNTRNVEAYQHFLKAMAYRNGGGSSDEVLILQNAVDELVQAVTLAPDFARAWILLYPTYFEQIINAPQDRIPELEQKRQEAYNTARALAPDMPELQLADAEQQTARIEQERALLDILASKNSLQPLATAQYANFLANTGRIREALPYAEQAVRLNPTDVMGYYLAGSLLLIQGRLDEAKRVLERGRVVANGGLGGFLPVLGWKLAYAENGRQGWGERLLAERDPDSSNAVEQWNIRYGEWLVAQDPQTALDELRAYAMEPSLPRNYQAAFASIATMLGDLDLAEEYLNRFGILDPWDSHYSELRKRQGFKIWVSNNGLLDYWRASGNWGDFCRPLEDTENDFECF
jgi:adenylate cyclase